MLIGAKNIPTKGAELIANQLYEAGKAAKNPIVEVGSWLGGGTYHLARGAEQGNNVPIYVYDRFTIQKNEVRWADNQGVDIASGTDTMDIVSENVGYDNLYLIKTNVLNIEWCGRAIDVYVDDAGKRTHEFRYKMKQFESHFIRGQTKCFFMDCLFWKKTGSPKHKYQYDYVKKNYRLLETFGWEAGQLYLYQ